MDASGVIELYRPKRGISEIDMSKKDDRNALTPKLRRYDSERGDPRKKI
jgi:hypothetical protein